MNGTKAVDVMAMFDAMIQVEKRAGRFEASSYIEAARGQYASLLRERDALREGLRNIAEANYREWDDGVNTPFAFVEWAKSRARALLTAAAEGGKDGTEG